MRSLYTKILAMLLGSVFLASVLVGMAGIVCAEKVVKQDSAQILNLTGEEKRQEINKQLGAIEQSVENIYLYADSQLVDNPDLWSNRDYMTKYTDNLKSVLRTAGESTDSCIAVYIRFNQEVKETSDIGVFMIRGNQRQRFVDMPLTDIQQYEPDDVDHVGWYYEPLAKGKPTWMLPYHNDNIERDMISYVIPIFRGDTAIGVIGMDIDINLLKQFTKEVAVYDSGYAFLASSNGDIIYHKDYPDGIAVADFDEDLVQLGKIVGTNREEGKVYPYKWHGQKKQMLFFRLENKMYLMITAPSAEINAARDDLISQCVILLFLVIVCVAVFGTLIVRQVTRPLRRLTDAAQQVADGNWDVDIRCNSKDEVGILADTLQNTLKALNEYVTYVSDLAYTDVLTGLKNKQAYNEAVTKLDTQIADKTADFSLVLLEINNLKQITDTYGRGASEGVVIAATALMKQVFGSYDIYCISDDCFAVVCRGESYKRAEVCTRRFEEELEHFNRVRTACPEEISIAVGFAYYKKDTDRQFSDVFVRADGKMYHDKQMLGAKLGMREDALQMLRMVFHKILKVNLVEDTYYEIKTYDEEHTAEMGYSSKISEWMEQFAVKGQVFEEDREDYLAFTSIERLRARMLSGETYLSHRYRRKVGEAFRWVQMEIIPSVEYTKDDQIVMFYIRDIHDSYAAEIEYQKELERLTNTDALTGLFNRHYMISYCNNFCKITNMKIGVIFCDLNGLKYTNDHFGHAAGDALIVRFAQLLKESFPHEMCCRMSGDEFVVIVLNKSEEVFGQMAAQLRESNTKEDHPLASIGLCWQQMTEDIQKMLKDAENGMYVDKQFFYANYPEYRR